MFDGRDTFAVVIKAVAVVHKDVDAGEVFACVDIDDAGVGDKECVGKVIEGFCVFFEEARLWLADSTNVMVAGGKDEGDVFWDLGEEACAFCVLFFDVGDGEFFFL